MGRRVLFGVPGPLAKIKGHDNTTECQQHRLLGHAVTQPFDIRRKKTLRYHTAFLERPGKASGEKSLLETRSRLRQSTEICYDLLGGSPDSLCKLALLDKPETKVEREEVPIEDVAPRPVSIYSAHRTIPGQHNEASHLID